MTRGINSQAFLACGKGPSRLAFESSLESRLCGPESIS